MRPGRLIRRVRLKRCANPKKTNNLSHQTEIRPILLSVAEPETDRVRMLREQGSLYRSGDVDNESEAAKFFTPNGRNPLISPDSKK
jgi:hypothetical protein